MSIALILIKDVTLIQLLVPRLVVVQIHVTKIKVQDNVLVAANILTKVVVFTVFIVAVDELVQISKVLLIVLMEFVQ